MTDTDVTVVAVLAPAVGRATVEPLSGQVTVDDRGATISAPDAAALEVALRVGEAWGVPVHAYSVGGTGSEVVLAEARAVGVDRAVHIVGDDDAPADRVAAALAARIGTDGRAFVVAGVHGSDIASAAVPACVAHHLGAEQALGTIGVEPGGPGRCEVVRRLDRGARERLVVRAPAVVSVEGSVARLRRAGLRAVLAADHAGIERVRPEPPVGPETSARTPRPWRPRTRVVAGPGGSTALERIRDLTGVASDEHQVRTVELDPAAAAELIIDELGSFGFGPRAIHDG